VLINADGAGSAAGPFAVYNNSFVGGCINSVTLLCNHTVCSVFNIAPGSFIDRRGETSPVATNVGALLKQCP
jgi:hypothetical protein